jgi:putative transposase
VPSIGSVGDSYDNALAAALNSLYKAELIRRQGPWRKVDDVELATLSRCWPAGWLTRRPGGASIGGSSMTSSPRSRVLSNQGR